MWASRIVLAAVLVGVFLTAGCGSLPARMAFDRSVEQYALSGRFGLRDKGQAYQGRLQWQQTPVETRVLVQDPFGGGVAELSDGVSGARLRLANGEVTEAADARQLMLSLTGVALPVSSVGRWLTGRALPTSGVERDALGRAVRFFADGWQVEYEYESAGPADADLLPLRVSAADRRGIELRLAIESWTFDGQ